MPARPRGEGRQVLASGRRDGAVAAGTLCLLEPPECQSLHSVVAPRRAAARGASQADQGRGGCVTLGNRSDAVGASPCFCRGLSSWTPCPVPDQPQEAACSSVPSSVPRQGQMYQARLPLPSAPRLLPPATGSMARLLHPPQPPPVSLSCPGSGDRLTAQPGDAGGRHSSTHAPPTEEPCVRSAFG